MSHKVVGDNVVCDKVVGDKVVSERFACETMFFNVLSLCITLLMFIQKKSFLGGPVNRQENVVVQTRMIKASSTA